jgi:peptidoglycan/LPS O-acetylase OafA/YrhL
MKLNYLDVNVNKGRIPSLDGFRTVSVFLVIFSHLALSQSLPDTLNKILGETGFGLLGARMFFVISGFIITYLLLKEKSSTGSVNLKAFYIRRSLRIFPVFYFYLLAIALLNYFLNLKIPSLAFLSGGLFIHNFEFWGTPWLIEHTWTLAIEEQFYLIWPSIFISINKLKNLSLWFIILLIGSLMRVFHYKFTGMSNYFLSPFLMHADFLFSGCFIAFYMFYYYDTVVKFISNARIYYVYVAIGLILICSMFEFHPDYDKIFIPISGAVVNTCICFLLLYFLIKKDTAGYKFLNLPVVVFIGQLSYSLYIWQQLFLSGYNFWWTKFPQNIILTFLTAYISHRIIEKPFLKLKDKISANKVSKTTVEVV